jgi:hypothetical protein
MRLNKSPQNFTLDSNRFPAIIQTLMKKAALVIGLPNTGKSTTIREFRKLVETRGLHVFVIDGKLGFTWLTSFEEYDREVEPTIEDHIDCDFLLFACQGPKLPEVHKALKAESFEFKDCHVKHYSEAPSLAQEILKFFKSK